MYILYSENKDYILCDFKASAFIVLFLFDIMIRVCMYKTRKKKQMVFYFM
jgi:hypothetical protein